MATKTVQISLPDGLLKIVDAQPETREHGRSAVVRRALLLYLDDRRRSATDAAYARAYGGEAETALDEFGPLMERQRWPDK